MSVIEHMNKRGKTRVQRMLQSSDKTVQAEMKNKQEAYRLNLNRKILDKQFMHLKFSIEKEKLLSKRLMSQMMKKTTGVSRVGLAPDGPWDTAHQSSPYFHCESAISEKRIKHWRQTEAKLQRDLKHMAGAEIRTSDDPDRKTKEKSNLKIVLGMMGYNEADTEEILDTMGKGGITPQAVSDVWNGIEQTNGKQILMEMKRTSFEVPDVFASLRNTEQCESEHSDTSNSNMYSRGSSRVPSKETNFSVKDWEKKLLDDYIKGASSQTHRVRKTETGETHECIKVNRPHSSNVLHRRQQNRGSDKKKYSTPHVWSLSDDEDNSFPKDNDYTSSQSFSKITPLRPHSANGELRHKHIRYMKQNKRPKTAGSKGTTKINNFIKVQSIKQQNCNDQHSSSSNCIAMKDVSDQDLPATLSSVTTETIQTDLKVNSATSNKPRNVIHQCVLKDKLEIPRSVLKSTSASSIASNVSQLTVKSSCSDVFLSEDEKSISVKKQVTFSPGDKIPTKQKLLERTRSFHGLPKAQKELQRQTLHNIQFPQQSVSLYKPHPSQETGYNNLTEAAHKILSRRNSTPGNMYHIESQGKHVSTESLTDHSHTSEDGYKNSPGSSLPRWKRDLLREAPPSVSTSKINPKFAPTVSRAQLRRDLQQMVEDNVQDVKKICGIEQERRRQSRANIFMTMIKVKQAVETFKSTVADKSSKRSPLGSSDIVADIS